MLVTASSPAFTRIGLITTALLVITLNAVADVAVRGADPSVQFASLSVNDAVPQTLLTRLSQNIAGQDARFRRLSVDDGLSQAAIQTIHQDQQGFIWLGTQSGLNRFDGRRVVNYFHDPNDEHSLSHSWIWAIHETSNGTLWLGTGRGGLNRFDRRSGRFASFQHDPQDPASLPHNTVRAIADAGNDRLWIGTEGGGLSRFNPASGSFEQIPLLDESGSAVINAAVVTLALDPQGLLWVGTDGQGLYKQRSTGLGFDRVALPRASTRIRTLAHDGNTTLWIGTFYQGVMAYTPEAGIETIRHYQAEDQSGQALSSNLIRTLLVDASGKVWVGTYEHGLNLIDPHTGNVSQYRADTTEPTSLSDDHVMALYQDQGKVLWVGTYVGASYWNSSLANFRTLSRQNNGADQLSDNYVTSIAVTDSTLWIGTHKGINAIQRNTGAIETFRHDPAESNSVSQDLVWALAASPDGNIWIGTQNKGLNRFNPETRQFQVFQHDASNPDSLSGDRITSLEVTPDGGLWVGTFGNGLNFKAAGDDRFVRLRADTITGAMTKASTGLASNVIFTLLLDASGQLWVGTDQGLTSLDGRGQIKRTLRHVDDDRASLSDDIIWALHEDRSGNLWIGTESAGLNLWRAEDRATGRFQFQHYGQEQGLTSPTIYAIESDSGGNLWLSTNNGLFQFNTATQQFRRFTTTHGLQHNEFNFAAVASARNGELFFGGINGLTAFHPHQIIANPYPPRLAITRILRMNKPGTLPELRNAASVVEFTHADRLLTFEYAALDFSAPERNQFMHKLEGFDSQWVDDQSFDRATYTNLATGNYQLLVKAANADGIWSPTPLSIPIRILPPPWATNWAYSAYLLLFLGIALALIRNGLRRSAYSREIKASNRVMREEIAYRQTQQRALKHEKLVSQRYLDVVEVMILVLDHAGNITLINQKGLRMLDRLESDLIGRNFYDLLLPDSVRLRVREQFEALTGYVYSESPVLAGDNQERMMAWHATPIPPMENNPGGLIISGTDVTEMRDMERRMAEARKVEALGNLARGIAHDFNNILSSILGYAELSLQDLDDNSPVAANLRQLEASVNRGRQMVDGILSFSSRNPQSLQATALQDVIEEVLNTLRPSVGDNIKVTLNLDRDCAPVLANPTLLSRVLMNLFTNACQAIGTELGELYIELAEERSSASSESTRLESIPESRPDKVRLVVRDTGSGMDEATLSQAFDPFFTTRPRGVGTGLGLSVVRSILAQLGAEIDVSSEPGAGSSFQIRFPACLETVDVIPKVAVTMPQLQGNETLLFVDDEPSVVSIATEMLKRLGYTIFSANSGVEALAQFETHGKEIDLVITDQTMRGIQGLQLAHLLKKRRADLPVMMISGAGASTVDDPSILKFVSKPYTRLELATAIRQVLDRSASDSGNREHWQAD